MRRESDKYHFKEPFGRDIRKKMIESQKKAMHGPEKFLKLGQLKPTQLATVGHVATGIIQVERKPAAPPKVEKKYQPKEKKPKKAKKAKRKKASRTKDSDTEAQPVEKKAKKGIEPKKSNKKISNISLAEFDDIRKQFPGMPTGVFRIFLFLR